MKSLKAVLEYLSIECPDVDFALKELKAQYKGQMTKKEMEEEVKADLVRRVVNHRQLLAQSKSTMKLWR